MRFAVIVCGTTISSLVAHVLNVYVMYVFRYVHHTYYSHSHAREDAGNRNIDLAHLCERINSRQAKSCVCVCVQMLRFI